MPKGALAFGVRQPTRKAYGMKTNGPSPDETWFQTNRKNWNERVEHHFGAKHYDVQGFLSGRCTLRPVDFEALGDVAGKRILHLQCHFGLDSLSLSRMGGLVTGVDFSDTAIQKARELGEVTGLSAEFHCAEVYSVCDILDCRSFDLVFASYGVFCWISDLYRWFSVASAMLKPHGRVFIVDGHPVLDMLSHDAASGTFSFNGPYFHEKTPELRTVEKSYTGEGGRLVNSTIYVWSHHMGEFATAAGSAGLTIHILEEFPYCHYRRFSCMVQRSDGYWEIPDHSWPLMFSMDCSKAPIV